MLMAECLTPFKRNHKITGEIQHFPCGKCPNCIKRRVSGWSERLRQEDRRSETAEFITLTYTTDTVPITKNGFMSLKKRDVQLFLKRLRKSHEIKWKSGGKTYISQPQYPIRYYVCGEYGGKTNRPHYHIILFNCDLRKVEAAWQNGAIHSGTVTGASVGYTLKYMSKPSKIPMHRNDDRVKEFSLMSKGIGQNYITPAKVAWHHADLTGRMYMPIEDGKKIAMPRYYKDKIYTEDQRKIIAEWHKVEGDIRSKDNIQRLIKEYGDDYYRMKLEGDLKLFRKMFADSEKGRNVV
ncbi:replication initiator protein [Apis mellifera associated microvirus 59]|nr:replication initiator protein [Apis mellifera associated microvirus 59]